MAKAVTRSTSEATVSKNRLSKVLDVFKRLVKEKPLGAVGLMITLILLFTGIFANWLAPYGMNEMTGDFLTPPSAGHLLGTDNIGRDLLTRIIYGARVSVIVGLCASGISSVVGILIGMVSGYVGGKFDLIVQRFVDAVFCFPSLILVMVISSLVGPGLWNLIYVIGITWGVITSRVARSATIAVKENMYVQAVESIGGSSWRVLLQHILPNIFPIVIVQFSVQLPGIILTEASLSFLGFGITPPTPSWGGMLSMGGRAYMFMAPWMAIWPGVALAIVVYGINMFGDALRDILDPRLKGTGGRYGGPTRKKLQKLK